MKFWILFSAIIGIVEMKAASAIAKTSGNQNLSEVDQCLADMQKQMKNKNLTRTLAGLVGYGWDDLKNEYTLPIISQPFKDCKTDLDNKILVADNVFLIPIKKTDLDRTSSVFNSFEEFSSKSSDKVTVSGGGGKEGKGKVSASFSKESSKSKEEFVKVDSIMLRNKVVYDAYLLIVNENAGLDEGFIGRVNAIADAVHEGHHRSSLKAQFLAQLLVADYGTHVISQATATAEIVLEKFYKKVEQFKGKSSMDAIKVSAAGEFEGQAYGGKLEVGYSNEQNKSNNESKTSTESRTVLKSTGGPSVNRISNAENESMMFVDTLVGKNQVGKFIYDLIPAVKMSKYPRMTKYTVKKLVYDAVQQYYKFNSLPGCMDMTSENYNNLANIDDGSCETPNDLFTFAGIYQKCLYSFAYADGRTVEHGGQCSHYEIKNRITGNFSCPENTTTVFIDFVRVQFSNRTVRQLGQKCLPIFSTICWQEMMDVQVYEEIVVQAYSCTHKTHIQPPTTEKKETSDEDVRNNIMRYFFKPANKDLNSIMRYEILNILEDNLDILKAYFPSSYKDVEMVENEEMCPKGDPKTEEDVPPMTITTFVGDLIDGAERKFRRGWKHRLPIKESQLNMLKDFPKLTERLLSILAIDEEIINHKDLHKDASINFEFLTNKIFKNADKEVPVPQMAYFGGMFQGENRNPFTGKPECPAYFEEYEILNDLKICISYETASRKWPIMFSSFRHYADDCPKGYSSYLAGTIETVDYFYCIRFYRRNENEMMRPVLTSPPFFKFSMADSETTEQSSSSTSSSTKNYFSFF